jgi:O-antigen/teichoic acid export membrane protein
MRPRLSIARIGELFAFSQWALVRGIGYYLVTTLDRVLVGRRSSTEVMGAYNVASEISSMPSGELLAPLYRALFPAFVQARANPEELKRMYLLAQGLQATLVIPISVGLALVAPEIVPLVLGTKWLLAVPLLQVRALAEAGQALLTGAGYILLTMGKVRSTAVIAWAQVLGLVVPALVLFPQADALEIAWLRVASVVIGVFVSVALLRGALAGLRQRDVGANAWRPLLASGVMAVVVVGLGGVVQGSLWIALLVKVFVGAVAYVLGLLVLWILAGRPVGGETYVIEKTSLFWNRIRRSSDSPAR